MISSFFDMAPGKAALIEVGIFVGALYLEMKNNKQDKHLSNI